ncbi:hypothetical protein EC968_006774 [Mortierella alpina]|nr:hypothetical protein EC968_006774 [Mortierella alpina]
MSGEDNPPHQPSGNGAPIKLSFGKGKGVSLTKKNTPLKRSGSNAFDHSEEKTENHDELISGLQGNRIESIAPKEEAKVLVIPKLENADWRQQALAKRKMTFNPTEGLAAPSEVREETGKTLGFGLQIQKRVKIEHKEPSGLASESGPMDVDTLTKTITAVSTKEEKEVIVTDEETLDQAAARKIIQAASGEMPADARNLILRGQENVHADEVEAFQKNLDLLPDEASLEDYEKVPVEDFGAALLRGMGWKGDSKGSEAIEFHRRPALLGLGAKPKEPEPITKKYIKPGESRTPQAVRVPERHRTGLPSSSSHRDGHRDSRHSRGNRDNTDSRDKRYSRDDRDNTDSRDRRDGRDSRNDGDRHDRREDGNRGGGKDEKHNQDDRESRSSADNRRAAEVMAAMTIIETVMTLEAVGATEDTGTEAIRENEDMTVPVLWTKIGTETGAGMGIGTGVAEIHATAGVVST